MGSIPIVGSMASSFNGRTDASGASHNGSIPLLASIFMAHLSDHCRDCENILGIPCKEVNVWMDAAFKRFGPRHRFERHHWEGVRKAEELFGREGRKAALIHVLKDCGHIPRAKDYGDGTVDVLGMPQGDDEVFNGYWDAVQFKETALLLLENDDNNQSIFGT